MSATIETALVLLLANQIKEQKEAKGVRTTDDCVGEAIKLIQHHAPQVQIALKERGL